MPGSDRPPQHSQASASSLDKGPVVAMPPEGGPSLGHMACAQEGWATLCHGCHLGCLGLTCPGPSRAGLLWRPHFLEPQSGRLWP